MVMWTLRRLKLSFGRCSLRAQALQPTFRNPDVSQARTVPLQRCQFCGKEGTHPISFATAGCVVNAVNKERLIPHCGGPENSARASIASSGVRAVASLIPEHEPVLPGR